MSLGRRQLRLYLLGEGCCARRGGRTREDGVDPSVGTHNLAAIGGGGGMGQEPCMVDSWQAWRRRPSEAHAAHAHLYRAFPDSSAVQVARVVGMDRR